MSYVQCSGYAQPVIIIICDSNLELYSSQSHKEQASQIDVLEMKTKQVEEV